MSLVIFAALCAVVQQQKPVLDVWVKSALSPAQIATLADKRIASLKNVQLLYDVKFDLPNVEGAQGGFANLQDRSHYLVSFPLVRKDVKSALERASLIPGAKGAKVFVPNLKTGKSTTKPYELPTSFVAGWFPNFPKWMFNSYVSKTTPLTAFVKEASKAGLEVTGDERTMEIKGRTYKHYRIMVQRPSAKISKIPYFVEIVIDAKHELPIRINTDTAFDGGEAKCNWRGAWTLKLKKPFTKADLIPGPVK